GTEPELTGRRLYFSAIRRISVMPEPSGRYAVRGVLEPMIRDNTDHGFNDYLVNLGIRQKLTRAHILSQETPPNRLQRFYQAGRERLAACLAHGLERHPATASLYVAMLLGGKAGMSAEQQDAFMRSGTFHLFSISGLHVGVIAGALQGLCWLLRVPARVAV